MRNRPDNGNRGLNGRRRSEVGGPWKISKCPQFCSLAYEGKEYFSNIVASCPHLKKTRLEILCPISHQDPAWALGMNAFISTNT